MFASGTDWYVVMGYPTNMRSGSPISTLWWLRSGAWLPPAGGGSPVRLDWHSGYSLPNIDHLFAVKPALGGVLAFRSNNVNGASVNPIQVHMETQVMHPQTAIIRTFATNYSLVQDDVGHLWNLITPQPGTQRAIRRQQKPTLAALLER